MKWILENLWTLLIIAGVVSQLINAIRGKKDDDADAPPAQPKEYEFEDPELADRTRKIREEIQRKIAERQRGGGVEPAPQAESAAGESVGEEMIPPVVREVVVARAEPPVTAAASSTTRWDSQRSAEMLEEQAAMMEKLREAELMKAAAIRRAAFENETKDHQEAGRRQARGQLMTDLRDPAALRRAFVLREVLGPPVAMR